MFGLPIGFSLFFVVLYAFVRKRFRKQLRKMREQGWECDCPRPDDTHQSRGVGAEYVRMKHWKAYAATRRFQPSLKEKLCDCFPTDAFVDPEREQMCKRGHLQFLLLTARTRIVEVFILLLLFVYAPLAAKSFGLLNCVNVGDIDMLVVDFKIECTGTEYTLFALWAVVAIIVYVCGIPVLTLSLVWRERTHNVEQYIDDLFFDDREAAVKAVNGGECTGGMEDRPTSFRPVQMSTRNALDTLAGRPPRKSRGSDAEVAHLSLQESRRMVMESPRVDPQPLPKKDGSTKVGIKARISGALRRRRAKCFSILDFVLNEDTNINRRQEVAEERGYQLTERDLAVERKQVLESAFHDALLNHSATVDPNSHNTEELKEAVRTYLYRLNLTSYWTSRKIGKTFSLCKWRVQPRARFVTAS